MALSKERMTSLCAKFGKDAKDTGDAKVQVAIFTERIKDLTAHCKIYKKDVAAARNLVLIVGKRKRMLKYLQRRDLDLYRSLIKELGLRK